MTCSDQTETPTPTRSLSRNLASCQFVLTDFTVKFVPSAWLPGFNRSMSMQVKRLNDISNLENATATSRDAAAVAACQDPTYPEYNNSAAAEDFDSACLFLCHSVERPTAAPVAVNYFRSRPRVSCVPQTTTWDIRGTLGWSGEGQPPAASASIFIDSFRAQTNLLFG